MYYYVLKAKFAERFAAVGYCEETFRLRAAIKRCEQGNGQWALDIIDKAFDKLLGV